MAKSSVHANGYVTSAAWEMERVFNDLAPKISTDWRRLGRKLGIPASKVEAIDEDKTSTEEKAFKTLKTWHCKFGHSHETIAVLAQALEDIGNKLLADEIRDYEVPVNIESGKMPAENEQIVSNGYHLRNDMGLENLISMGEQHTIMLETFLMELATCDSKSLAEKLGYLQNLKKTDKILEKMIENHELNTQNIPNGEHLKDLKNEHRVRVQRTRQAMLFTEYLLEQRKNGIREHRTRSELPKRNKSYADLQTLIRRSNTFSSQSKSNQTMEISLPICTIKSQVEERCNTKRHAQSKDNGAKTSYPTNNVEFHVGEVQENDGKDKVYHGQSTTIVEHDETTNDDLVRTDDSETCTTKF